jgi:hypothetical protein
MATVLYGIDLGDKQSDMATTNPSTATAAHQLEIKVDLAIWTNTADLRTYLELMTDQIIAKWKPS